MAEWIFGPEQGGCAWLGRGPGKRSERRSRLKAICPNAMRSFWKVAAFRLTESIRIQSGRRALRCFQNELHHFIISNLKWYYIGLLKVFTTDHLEKVSVSANWPEIRYFGRIERQLTCSYKGFYWYRSDRVPLNGVHAQDFADATGGDKFACLSDCG